jgi:hypothetical protein
MKFNHAQAVILPERLPHMVDQCRYAINGKLFQVHNHGVEGLVQPCVRMALEHAKETSFIEVIVRHQPSKKENNLIALVFWAV